MNATDIRQSFLRHFERHGHTVLPSSPLVPQNDPTLYFTNAGMVQFKDWFTGTEAPKVPRAATSQKCLRISGKHNDLDNVGRTPRHHTFFEMLGNFSFGDYFKDRAIALAWELLTEVWRIDADRLWVTVFEDDDEAFELWREIGFPEARLQRLGAKDNFWMMGPTGPCGPCSEIHYDHGPAVDPNEGGPATGSDRYVEIWNLVFMQYEQREDGSRSPLPKPSIDTGMGLERVAAVLQGVVWNYDTDLFQPLMRKAAGLAGVTYGRDAEVDTALRVIADHARATAFLVGDGVMPSNEERGYELRRVMRRGIAFGKMIGLDRPFLHEVTAEVIAGMRDAYPELAERADYIASVVVAEEERFRRTLDRGMRLLEAEITGDRGTLDGQVAFKLHDTFGFPIDLTQIFAERRGWRVDVAGFHREMEQQKQRGRETWVGSGEQAVGELWHRLHAEHGDTRFTGYETTEGEARVLALVQLTGTERAPDFRQTDRLAAGDRGIVILDRSPFYAESGGQVGDTGTIGTFRVTDTRRAVGLHLHQGEAVEPIAVGDRVAVQVDAERRDRVRRNHTGTHLLHAALRNVLGTHVVQKGSLVAPDRLRFDFAHPQPMTAEEIAAVEREVNAQVLANRPLETRIEDFEQAVASGAMALFGEKYDARVRVVTVPGYSVELCGGTHCARTGDIGFLKIVSESGVAAGVRRIEALTGDGAIAWANEQAERLAEAARKLKTEPARVVEAIGRLQEERRAVERQLAEMRREVAKAAAGDLVQRAREVNGIRVLAAEFDGDLREQADRLRDQLGSSLVVLLSQANGRVQLVAAASKDIAGTRIHAGKVIQEIAPLVGGKGGGRPDLAQAGGSDPAGIPAAVDRVYTFAAEALGG